MNGGMSEQERQFLSCRKKHGNRGIEHDNLLEVDIDRRDGRPGVATIAGALLDVASITFAMA